MKMLIIILSAFILVSCGPLQEATQTVMDETDTVSVANPIYSPIPSNTSTPSNKSLPTNTKTPRITYTPQPSWTRGPTQTATETIEQMRMEFASVIAQAIEESINDVETLTMARVNNGRLEIELKTQWASQDSQPSISYDVIQLIAYIFGKSSTTPEKLGFLVGSDIFTIYLVTYSTRGDYRYESITNYDTLIQLYNRLISYNEWVIASNAGFR